MSLGGWLRKIFGALEQKPTTPSTPNTPTTPTDGLIDPPWLKWMEGELGTHEIKGGETPRIIWYAKHTSLQASEDEVAWCASFMCAALEENGLKSPHNAWAQSFANDPSMEKLTKPIHGCICVYRWTANNGHVNVYNARKKQWIGGNQSDPNSGGRVSYADYSDRQQYILAYVWPKGFPKTGVAPSTDHPSTTTPTQVPVAKGWSTAYDSFIYDHLSPELIKASIKSLWGTEPTGEAKKQALIKILKAVAKAESNFNPTERYVETGISDKDSVTGKQNVSEGLFQLSYQDSKLYSCEFDWSVDKNLSSTDAKKTIFAPLKNIDCAMKIFTKLLKNHPGESLQTAGARYWSTLRPGKGLDRTKAALEK